MYKHLVLILFLTALPACGDNILDEADTIVLLPTRQTVCIQILDTCPDTAYSFLHKDPSNLDPHSLLVASAYLDGDVWRQDVPQAILPEVDWNCTGLQFTMDVPEHTAAFVCFENVTSDSVLISGLSDGDCS